MSLTFRCSPLRCFLGWHRWNWWERVREPGAPVDLEHERVPMLQERYCRDCGRLQRAVV